MPSRSHALSRPDAITRPAPFPARCEPLEARRLLAADLVATGLTGKLPDDLVDGTRPRIPHIGVDVNNAGNADVKGPVIVQLFASADGVLDAGDTMLSEQTTKLVVSAGRSRHVPIKLRTPVPNIAEGSYRLLAVVDATNTVPEDNEGNNIVASTGSIAIGPPFVNLTATSVTLPVSVASGKAGRVTLVVLNGGNTNAKGTGVLQVTFNPVGPGTGFTDTASVKVKVRSRKSGNLRGRVAIPSTLAAGQYTVTATLTTVTGFTDRNLADNTATGGPVTVR